nr:non-structural maintenance of chromosomes element 4 homolog A-like [Nerophis lumbriciformis]
MGKVRGRSQNRQATQQDDIVSSQENGEQQSGVEGFNFGSINQEGYTDISQRRETRNKYRNLIDVVQRNREELMTASNTQLFEVLKEADELLDNVNKTSEAVLDSKVVFVATQLNEAKVDQLQQQEDTFDVFPYVDHLLSFMGLNRLESEEAENTENGVDDYLTSDAWERLARRAEDCFSTAPSYHYMLGSFHAEPPTPKQRVERQRKLPSKEAKRIMPTLLKKVEENEQEATEKEVDRILSILNNCHLANPSSKIPYYQFVIDPDSFSRTIENIFNTSFLIRDGSAKIHLDKYKVPYIAPVDEPVIDATEIQNRNASIVSMSQKFWRETIEVMDIKNAMIPPLTTASQQYN